MSKNVCIASRAWLLLLDVDVLSKVKFTGGSEVEPVAISALAEVPVNAPDLQLPRRAGQTGLCLDLLAGDGDWQRPKGGRS